MDNILFDRYVDITLQSSTNGKTFKIVTPKTGRKPDIEISGSILPSPVIATMMVKIVNFYSSIPLGDYDKITIEAGYRNSESTRVTISGAMYNMQVGWAYQESPSPDGVTVFTFMLGDFVTWTSKMIDYSGTAGNKVTDIFDLIAQAMGFTTKYGPGISDLVWDAPVSFSGPCKNLFTQIATDKGFVIRVEGKMLVCYFSQKGKEITQQAKTISFLSSPPQKNSPATISFVAPWRPDIVPGDLIKIDPRYAKQSFGGSFMADSPDALYVVNTLDFDFSTVGSQNSMKIEAIKYTAGAAK